MRATRSPTTDKTLLERMEEWFRNQPVFAVLIIASAMFLGVAEVINHGNDFLVTIGLRQEKTLELATNTAKAEFSRRLIESAWRRLFWSRNFVARVERQRPAQELDFSWNKYLDSVADWSADLMVNMNALDEYYGKTDKPLQFQKIQDEFISLEGQLADLRDPDKRNQPAIDKVKSEIDQINTDLYFFSLNRNPGEGKSK